MLQNKKIRRKIHLELKVIISRNDDISISSKFISFKKVPIFHLCPLFWTIDAIFPKQRTKKYSNHQWMRVHFFY